MMSLIYKLTSWFNPMRSDQVLLSENKHLIYKDGAVFVNYNNPEMKEKLKAQLDEYAKINVNRHDEK